MIEFVWFMAFGSLFVGNGGTSILCFIALAMHYLG